MYAGRRALNRTLVNSSAWITSVLLSGVGAYALDVPKAEIANGQIRALIYLPDAHAGFYRSTRFDWSGVVASLTYRGREYYGPWFHKVDPNVRDYTYDASGVVASPVSATLGPAEEYQTDGKALGYEEAKGGGTFIKIGIGVLRKPVDEVKYDHYRQYEIVDGGKWTIHTGPTSVEFTQQLSDPSSHYGYRYTKVMRLTPGKPQLVIEHTLENIGSRAIRSTMYNHNFLVFDGEAPGPNLVTKTAYEIRSQHAPAKEFGEIRGNQLVYLKNLEKEERLTTDLSGFGTSANDFDFRVEQHGTGAAVRMTGDRSLANATVWSIRTVFALEPFVALDVEPGAKAKWSLTYDYYTVTKSGDSK